MQDTTVLRYTKVGQTRRAKVKVFDFTWLAIRLAMGYLMLDAGISKLTEEGWTAAGFLSHGSGPFADGFASLAGNGAVDALVISGEILIGAALVLGVAVRPAAFLGAVMMLLFYLPYLPPEHGWVSQHVVYMLVFIALIFSGTGYFIGLDRFAKKAEDKIPALKLLLG
jgi:thiosulfate dehydrogenase [quinone] large subunit